MNINSSILFFFSNVLLWSPLFAVSYQQYIYLIPNGQNVKVDGKVVVGIGHVNGNGGGKRNSFGQAFSNNGKKWTVALCNLDSDGDGYNNGQELGDPECTWTQGQIPKQNTDISHPGLLSSVPSVQVSRIGKTSQQSSVNTGKTTQKSSANTPQSSTENSADATAVNNPEVEGISVQVAVHAIFMAVAFVFLMPVGIMMPVLFKHEKSKKFKWWFDVHVYSMIFTMVFAMTGFFVLISYFIKSGETLFQTKHGIVGLIFLILLLIQPVIGFIRPHKTDNPNQPQSTKRIIWELIHQNYGRVLFIISMYLVWTGLGNLVEWVPISTIQACHWTLLTWIILLVSTVVIFKAVYQLKNVIKGDVKQPENCSE